MISMIVSQSSDNHTETKYTHHCDTTIMTNTFPRKSNFLISWVSNLWHHRFCAKQSDGMNYVFQLVNSTL